MLGVGVGSHSLRLGVGGSLWEAGRGTPGNTSETKGGK